MKFKGYKCLQKVGGEKLIKAQKRRNLSAAVSCLLSNSCESDSQKVLSKGAKGR